MSSRTALAGLFVAIALVVVVAPVAIAPAGDRAFADVAANQRPGASAEAATPDREPTDGPQSTETRPPAVPSSTAVPPPPTTAPAESTPAEPPASEATPERSAFRSPIGGTNGRTVRLDLAGPRDYVAQANLVQCVGASVQMMLNIIKPGANRTAAFQHRLQVQARSLSGPTPPGFVRSGAGVFGWAAALTLRGGGAYQVVGADSLRQAMRMAARAIHDQRRPVGLLVWRGRHAWVMSGYVAIVDRVSGRRLPRHARLHPRPAPPLRRTTLGTQPEARDVDLRRGRRATVRASPPRRDSAWAAFWRSIPGNADLEASTSWCCRWRDGRRGLMASPPFTKSPPELVERFDAAAERHPDAERRKMFGYPALFVGGNLATGLFADTWMVRLGPRGPRGPRRDARGGAVLADARPDDEGLRDAAAGRDRRRRRARRLDRCVRSPSRGRCRPRSRASPSVARAGRAAPGIGIRTKAVSCFDAPTLGAA